MYDTGFLPVDFLQRSHQSPNLAGDQAFGVLMPPMGVSAPGSQAMR